MIHFNLNIFKDFKDAVKYGNTIRNKHFWIVQVNQASLHLMECKTKIIHGEPAHLWRFAGWKDLCGNNGRPEKSIRCSTKSKRWKSFWLASELTRRDWQVSIISDEMKNLLTTKDNYHKFYKV